jgi:fibronectin-binding autotransporter adhesin
MTTSAPAFARLRPILAVTAVFAFATAFTAATTSAQTTVTLDGTSGTESISTAYTLSGDTTFDLGFFADYLVVGGGGGGGTGGGGSGALLEGSNLRLSATNPVTVGTGGAASPVAGTPSANGGSSSVAGLTAGGGGGGMGGAGNNGSSSGIGGAGLQNSITGSDVWYAGGGSGASATGTANGGGNGSFGGGGHASEAGGGGVVILRYAGDATGITGGTTNTAAVSGEAITTFTSGGTFSVNLAERLGATLTQPVGGSGNLTYSGPGRLTLAADSSYVGTTTISAGTLQVGTGGTAGSLGTGAVSIAAGSTLAFNRSDAIVEANAISGSGSLVQQGGSVLTLAADSTFSGTATIASGTLQVGNGGSTGSLGSGGITNDAVLAFRRSDAVVVANPITGSGSVVQEGSGSLTLNATNT